LHKRNNRVGDCYLERHPVGITLQRPESPLGVAVDGRKKRHIDALPIVRCLGQKRRLASISREE